MMAKSATPMRVIALFLLTGMLLLGCKEQRPSENTPAYMSAHGVIAGQPAQLKVGGEMFHIPADVHLQMFTSGDIVKGQADYLSIRLNRFAPSPTGAASIPGPSYGELWLRIEIRRSPGTRDGRENLEKKRPWSSIRDISEFQLKEYRDKRSVGVWGDFSYESLAGAPKTLMNEPIQFMCTNTYPNHGECWGGYRLNSEILVWYFFPTEWLPVWQQVHQHVVSTVEHYHQLSKP